MVIKLLVSLKILVFLLVLKKIFYLPAVLICEILHR